MAVCSIQIWYWEVCLEHLLGHHLGHFWYIIWSHVCGATCISDAGFCGRLCQYLMWHIVFSFYNSQNYSAFYYEEVTAFELSTSKVKTAVSTTFFINVFVFFPVFVFVFVFVISRWIQALSSFRCCMICGWRCWNGLNVAVYRQSANSGMEMEMMLLMEKMMKNPWLGRYPMGPTTRPSALGMSDSVIVWGFHLNCGIIWIVGDFHPYLIFVIFSPRALFLAKFFSTQKCVNRKIDLRQNSVNCQRKNVFHQNSVKCNRIL